jgi:hypothetical protein
MHSKDGLGQRIPATPHWLDPAHTQLYTELLDTHAEHECQGQVNGQARMGIERRCHGSRARRWQCYALHVERMIWSRNPPIPERSQVLPAIRAVSPSSRGVVRESCGRCAPISSFPIFRPSFCFDSPSYLRESSLSIFHPTPAAQSDCRI